MARRNESERDFTLKALTRSVLWGQGFSTRIDVLLAYNMDPRGKSARGKAGLTDLDVYGVRLLPGFSLSTAVADCTTTDGGAIERVFWLKGVSCFFSSDSHMLVRSTRIPEHAATLAHTLGITLVSAEDLQVLQNTFVGAAPEFSSPVWEAFFSPKLLGEALTRLSRLPEKLSHVERYRETGFWMEPTYARLQRVVFMLRQMAREGSRGDTFKLVFADFVWLYVLALWSAVQSMSRFGISRVEPSLRQYILGDEFNAQSIERLKITFETLVKRSGQQVSLPILPPYTDQLAELLVRLIRRPAATARLARRAEWLLVAQAVGGLGKPIEGRTDEDVFADKLLGDIAYFLVRAANLGDAFLDYYLAFIADSEHGHKPPPPISPDEAAPRRQPDGPEIAQPQFDFETREAPAAIPSAGAAVGTTANLTSTEARPVQRSVANPPRSPDLKVGQRVIVDNSTLPKTSATGQSLRGLVKEIDDARGSVTVLLDDRGVSGPSVVTVLADQATPE